MFLLVCIYFIQCNTYNIGENTCSAIPYINRMTSYCEKNQQVDACNSTKKRISNEDLFQNYINILTESQKSCNLNSNDYSSCLISANNCILMSESTDFCNRFKGVSINNSCIQYKQTFTSILRDTNVPELFDYSSIFKIVLATFSPTGEFIGYSPLKSQLQNCGSRNNKGNLWKKFGRNYYEKCFIDTSKLSLNFYEPFLYIEEQDLLIQIPVLPIKYIHNGEAINEGKDEVFYQLFNRFFLYDNYSQKSKQYASEISFTFNIKKEDHQQIIIPYLSIKYDKIKDSNEFQPFRFSAEYRLTNDYFMLLSIILIILLLLFGFSYFFFSLCIKYRTLISDVTNKYFIFSILGSLFNSIGTSFFLASFIMGFYLLCAYKWTNHLNICLEPHKYYLYLEIFIYVSLFFKLLGVIFQLINQSNGTFHFIDWDERSNFKNFDEKSRFLYRSRRMVATNEWMKLSTVRGIDTSFVIIFVLLILQGCKISFLQQPIPTTEKVNAGQKYYIIEIGLTSFIWLATCIIFWLLKRFIYWNIVGNPFTNFQQLCLSLNVSVVMMMCNTRGFYINGRQKLKKSHSVTNLTDNFDHKNQFDPEQNSQQSEIYSSPPSESSDFSEKNADKKDQIELYINTSSDEASVKKININDSDSMQTEPQRKQVDDEDDPIKRIEKKHSKKPNEKNVKTKIIDEGYKNIDNVGMKYIGSDSDDKTNGKGQTNNNQKESAKADDSSDDVDIKLDSDSDTGPENTHKIVSDSDSSEDSKSTSINTKNEISKNNPSKSPHSENKVDDDKTHDNKVINDDDSLSIKISDDSSEKANLDNEMHLDEKNKSNRKEPDKINIDKKDSEKSSSDIKIPDESSSDTKDQNKINSDKNNFDSDVANDKDETAVQKVKNFQFNPVNLIEEESEDEYDTTFESDTTIESDIGINDYSISVKSDAQFQTQVIDESVNDSNIKKTKKSKKQIKKRKIIDDVPILDPLDKKYKETNQVFEIFLENDFYNYVNMNDEVIDILHQKKKYKTYDGEIKSIEELNEDTNSIWCRLLSGEEPDYNLSIENMALVHTIFNVGPSAVYSTLFTIQKNSSFKESMLYGIEKSLMLFYLILFISIEMLSNASVSGLIVFIVDSLIVKFFKWKRRKYLLNHKYSLYESLVR